MSEEVSPFFTPRKLTDSAPYPGNQRKGIDIGPQYVVETHSMCEKLRVVNWTGGKL